MMPSAVAAREAIVLCVILMGFAVVFGVAVLLYRRRYLGRDSPGAQGFTLADARRMHRAGQLSDEEYERMRKSILTGMVGRRAEEAGGDRSELHRTDHGTT